MRFFAAFVGTNSWIKLQIRMVAAIKGFNRSWLSWLSCKKKYKTILNEYKTDKRANEISGSDRKQECKWFTEMDQWHGSRASVHNDIPASATESWTEDVIPSTPTMSQTTTSAPPTQEKKKKTQEKIETLLEQVVGNSGALLASFQESTAVLKNMDKNFAALIAKF